MKKNIVIVLVGMVILFVGCKARSKYPIIAKIGKHNINVNDFKVILNDATYGLIKSGKIKDIAIQHFYSVTIDQKILYLLAKESGLKINETDEYRKYQENFNKTRRDFYLKLGLNEGEIQRTFNEYWIQREFIEKKIKPTIEYKETDLKRYYETNKKVYFTVKPYIKGHRISVKVPDPEAVLRISAKLEKLKKQHGTNYKILKEKITESFGNSAFFIEDKQFNIDQLRNIFKKSPDEVNNILKTKENHSTDLEEINDMILFFYITKKQTEEIKKSYDEVKDIVLKNYIISNIQKIVAKKTKEYKNRHPITILVEDPASLL
jgi:hypothetical protein